MESMDPIYGFFVVSGLVLVASLVLAGAAKLSRRSLEQIKRNRREAEIVALERLFDRS